MASGRTQLEPYLLSGEQLNGDIQMYCPLHEDSNPSATVNFRKRVWICHAGCGSGKLSDLLALSGDWIPPVGSGTGAARTSTQTGAARPLPPVERLEGYAARLLSDSEALDYLTTRRGFTIQTIQQHGLGWNGRKYVVPIDDHEGNLVNVRYHTPYTKPKWVNLPGHGSPARLHPIDVVLANKELVWHEGEFDSYLSNQNGLPAFTATGGSKIVWQDDWDDLLRGKTVTLCFDSDNEGRTARNRVMPHLKRIGCTIKVATLPYPVTKDHGKDISDWWLDGHKLEEFAALTKTTRVKELPKDTTLIDYEKLRSKDMRDRPIAVHATVALVAGPMLRMPDKIEFTCDKSWKPAMCKHCPLGKKNGNYTLHTKPEDDLQVNLIHKRRLEPKTQMKMAFGIPPKCPVVDIGWTDRAAWHGEVRNGSNLSADATPILLFTSEPPMVGTTVELQGAIKYVPGQSAVMAVSALRPVETELDRFQLTPEQIDAINEMMSHFSSIPKEALEQIAEATEDYITRRFGQRWLHICTDLVYHSVLNFRFQGELLTRGWLELLAVGESRAGKSTTLSQLVDWYGRGEVVPCEKVSVAGLIATSEKRAGGGGGENWVARIGKLPLMDRQLVVLDEAQGLAVEQIGNLSDMRSAGVIKVTQAAAIDTKARVRIIWLANPRQSGQTGVRALVNLMGNPEDIARVDLPMFLTSAVSEDEQWRWDNPPKSSTNPFDQPAARALLYWAWSRKPRDIEFLPGANKRVREIGDRLAEHYHSRIPLMPRNEARVRVARLSVAIAARLFSTDANGRKVKVRSSHVSAAGYVYAHLFKNPDLEYMTETQDMHEEVEAGRLHGGDLIAFIHENIWIRGFLKESRVDTRHIGQFFGQDSQYFLRKLTELGAINPEHGGYHIPNWARKIAQEVR